MKAFKIRGRSETYPSQSMLVVYGVVQPNNSHVLFTCNTHRE